MRIWRRQGASNNALIPWIFRDVVGDTCRGFDVVGGLVGVACIGIGDDESRFFSGFNRALDLMVGHAVGLRDSVDGPPVGADFVAVGHVVVADGHQGRWVSHTGGCDGGLLGVVVGLRVV